MIVKEFCERTVEGYLFHDLNQMLQIRVDGDGNCGYPIVMSVLSGIELLGTLTFPHSIVLPQPATPWSLPSSRGSDPELGKPQFEWYWKHFLTPINPSRYKLQGGISELIRSLIRNGLAHVFVAKAGIEVRKFDPASHMKSSDSAGLIIDATQFAADFKRSYSVFVRPILDGKDATIKGHVISDHTMQDRLNELAAAYTQEAGQMFQRMPGAIPRMPTLLADSTASHTFALPGILTSFSVTGTMFPGPEQTGGTAPWHPKHKGPTT